MSNLREPLSSAALSSLEWSPIVERTIDRVAASGKAPRLGLDIWKAAYGLESKAFNDAIEALTEAYLGRYKRESPELAAKICEQIVGEYIAQFCISCQGSREVMCGDLKVICNDCAGSGVRKYTDAERARMMKISFGLVCAIRHKFSWAYNHLSENDKAVNIVMVRELERNI